jgi:hypothetical protein
LDLELHKIEEKQDRSTRIHILDMNQEVWTVRSECKTLGKKQETREFTYRPDQTNQKIEEVIEAIRKVDRRAA